MILLEVKLVNTSSFNFICIRWRMNCRQFVRRLKCEESHIQFELHYDSISVVCVCVFARCAMGAALFGLNATSIIAPSLCGPTVVHSFHSVDIIRSDLVRILFYCYLALRWINREQCARLCECGRARRKINFFLSFVGNKIIFFTHSLTSKSLEHAHTNKLIKFFVIFFDMFAWCNIWGHL